MTPIDFIVTGWRRSGTTMFVSLLNDHPDLDCDNDSFNYFFAGQSYFEFLTAGKSVAAPKNSAKLRGLKTLPLRMKAHCANAQELAEWLHTHPAIEKVIYPGLPSHPQRELAARQMSGFGGIVSIVLKGGFEAAKRFCERTELFTLAESLGGVESLVNHPAVMTHASIPVARREKLGISDALVRLSVGVEDVEDLRRDLHSALDAAVA